MEGPNKSTKCNPGRQEQDRMEDLRGDACLDLYRVPVWLGVGWGPLFQCRPSLCQTLGYFLEYFVKCALCYKSVGYYADYFAQFILQQLHLSEIASRSYYSGAFLCNGASSSGKLLTTYLRKMSHEDNICYCLYLVIMYLSFPLEIITYIPWQPFWTKDETV